MAKKITAVSPSFLFESFVVNAFYLSHLPLGAYEQAFKHTADHTKTRWWFQICFIFIPTWGNDPI